MLAPTTPLLRPILEEDLTDVGRFLHEHLDDRLSAEDWAAAARVPWDVDAPNLGYQLAVGDRVVGVQLAFYSTRTHSTSHHSTPHHSTPSAGEQVERICNVGAWCVEEAYRAHGLRLLRALLAQRGYTFTDLSPSGNVVALNERLGFRRVDTPTSLTPALPWAPRRGTRVSSDPRVIERTLHGRDLEVYRDHRHTAAARHVVLMCGDDYCYVLLRRDARKGVRCFGTILHASNPDLLRSALRPLAAHLLMRHGVAAVLVEDRIAGGRPRGGVVLRRLQRPKMARGQDLSPDRIDYLYSELTCVAW